MINYEITITHHYRASIDTTFSSLDIVRVVGSEITRKYNNQKYSYLDALAELENILSIKYDADLKDDAYYINNEMVYKMGNRQFTYEGFTYKVEWDDDCLFEWCPECDDEAKLIPYFAPQFCECGHILLPCSMCENCSKKCPLEDLKKYIEETHNEIVFDRGNLRLNGRYMRNLADVLNSDYNAHLYSGRKVFWVDPCFHRAEMHTSDWKEIDGVYFEDDVYSGTIKFKDGTEAYISECYI